LILAPESNFDLGAKVIKFPSITRVERNIVTSIVGFGIFHALTQLEDHSDAWSRLETLSFVGKVFEMVVLFNIQDRDSENFSKIIS